MQGYRDSFWRRNRLPILMAAFYIVLLTPLMGRKNGYTIDATPSFQLTKTIVATGDFFPPNLRVKQGYIYSIAYAPFYIIGDAVTSIIPNVDADWARRKCMCWMNTVITALTLSVLSLTVRRLGHSRRAQLFVPILYGCSTMAFNYARYDYNKCLAALLLLLCFYQALQFADRKRLWNALFCGISLGLLASLRLELAIAAPALGNCAAASHRIGRRTGETDCGVRRSVDCGNWLGFSLQRHVLERGGRRAVTRGDFDGIPFRD